jgi:hypothetical protein
MDDSSIYFAWILLMDAGGLGGIPTTVVVVDDDSGFMKAVTAFEATLRILLNGLFGTILLSFDFFCKLLLLLLLLLL